MSKIKINNSNDSLFCIYSKEHIHLGEKYVEVKEDDIIKTYKIENAPVENGEEDPYIGE